MKSISEITTIEEARAELKERFGCLGEGTLTAIMRNAVDEGDRHSSIVKSAVEFWASLCLRLEHGVITSHDRSIHIPA